GNSPIHVGFPKTVGFFMSDKYRMDRYTIPGRDKISQRFNKEALDGICASCFRFLLEVNLSVSLELGNELINAKDFVMNNISELSQHASQQISYALRDMPISIIKQLINNDGIQSIKEFNKFTARAEALKHEWEEDLKEKSEEVKELKKVLDEYKTAFNFVGLYEGFNALSGEKESQAGKLIKWIIFSAILAMTPVTIELIIIYKHFNDISSVQNALLM